MYDSIKHYHSVVLFKEDILELEKTLILEGNFDVSNTEKVYSVKIDEETIKPISMYEFLNSQNPKDVEKISITFNEKGVKSLSIFIIKGNIAVTIEGIQKSWVKGMEQIIKSFFKKRKSIILQVASYFPGSITMLSIILIVNSSIEEHLLYTVLSVFLLCIALIFDYLYFTKKIFPSVKLSLTSKAKKNWGEIWGAVGAIVGILGFAYNIFS